MNEQEKIFTILTSGIFCDNDVDFLKKCLLSKDINIRKSAAHAVGSLKIRECFEALLEILSFDFGTTYSVAVVQFGSKVVGDIEKKLKNNPSVALCSNAAVVAGFFPGRKTLQILRNLIFEKSAQVRRVAAGNLGRMKCCRKEAVKIIKEALKVEKNIKVNFYLKQSLKQLE